MIILDLEVGPKASAPEKLPVLLCSAVILTWRLLLHPQLPPCNADLVCSTQLLYMAVQGLRQLTVLTEPGYTAQRCMVKKPKKYKPLCIIEADKQ